MQNQLAREADKNHAVDVCRLLLSSGINTTQKSPSASDCEDALAILEPQDLRTILTDAQSWFSNVAYNNSLMRWLVILYYIKSSTGEEVRFPLDCEYAERDNMLNLYYGSKPE